MRIATLFSGIGTPEIALRRIYPNSKTIFACEIDKFSRKSYKAMHEIDENDFHHDICELDGSRYRGKVVDILVGGSPCQSFSVAGLREGTNDHRGELIYEYIRVVAEVKAPIIIYENVQGFMSIDKGKTFRNFVKALEFIGYHCRYEVLNTKDYGVPQNRKRIYIVGFLDFAEYFRFSFAPNQTLVKSLSNVLEKEVDSKYYLSQKMIDGFNNKKNKNFKFKPKLEDEIAVCLTARYSKMSITDNYIIQHSRGFNKGGTHNICPTITKNSFECNNFVFQEGTIRRLTPLECWRLQDINDEYFVQAKEVVSNTQLYKQAGNAMSVNVLEMIIRRLKGVRG